MRPLAVIGVEKLQKKGIPQEVIDALRPLMDEYRSNPEALDTADEYRQAYLALNQFTNRFEAARDLQRRLGKGIAIYDKHISPVVLSQAERKNLLIWTESALYFASDTKKDGPQMHALDFNTGEYTVQAMETCNIFRVCSGDPVQKMVRAGEEVFALSQGGSVSRASGSHISWANAQIFNDCHNGSVQDIAGTPDGRLYAIMQSRGDRIGTYAEREGRKGIFEIKTAPPIISWTSLSFASGQLVFASAGEPIAPYAVPSIPELDLDVYHGSDCPLGAP